MDRNVEKRARGTRAAAVAGLLAIEGLIAACQPAATPTEKPTIQPTGNESPVPTLTATPKPSESASPVPSFTASPIPTEAPTITGIITAKEHPAVKPAVVKEEINTAYENNPKATETVSLKATQRNFAMCENGTPGDPKNLQDQDKVIGCYSTIKKMFETYQATGDKAFYQIAMDTYNYFVNENPKLKADLDAALNS